MRLPFTKSHIEAAKEFGITFDISGDLTEEQLCDLEVATMLALEKHGFDENYEPTETGQICEEIISILCK